METHAHELHKAPGNGLKHYFFEFFMLFLAVFCGFLAENFREMEVEKRIATNYSRQLFHDLKTDTLRFRSSIEELSLCSRKIDSLLILLKNPEERKNISAIYRLSMYAFVFPNGAANESTLQQLVNSGGLRYLGEGGLSDSIKRYYYTVQEDKTFLGSCSDFNLEFRKFSSTVLNMDQIVNFFGDSTIDINFLSTENGISIEAFKEGRWLSKNENSYEEYANWCALKKFYFINLSSRLRELILNSKAILKMLNDEYHIE